VIVDVDLQQQLKCMKRTRRSSVLFVILLALLIFLRLRQSWTWIGFIHGLDWVIVFPKTEAASSSVFFR